MCAYTHTINVDMCQTVQVCIKLFGYINTYFSYLNEPDKAWHISTSILHLDYKVKLQSKYIGAANYYSKQHKKHKIFI